MTEDVQEHVTLGELSRQLGVLERHINTTLGEQDRRYEQRWVASELSVKTALATSDKAIDAAKAANEKVLEQMDEISAKNMTREEYRNAHDTLKTQIEQVLIAQQDYAGLQSRIAALEAWQTFALRTIIGRILVAVIATVLVAKVTGIG